jgi:hypothetical protein
MGGTLMSTMPSVIVKSSCGRSCLVTTILYDVPLSTTPDLSAGL